MLGFAVIGVYEVTNQIPRAPELIRGGSEGEGNQFNCGCTCIIEVMIRLTVSE